MSDIFERSQQQNFFQLPETPEQYRQHTTPSGINQNNTSVTPETQTPPVNPFVQWNQGEQRRQEFRDQLLYQHGGAGVSMREFDLLYNLKEMELADDDDIFKVVSSRELGEYLGIDSTIVYDNYDAIWYSISEDRQEKYKLPRSRWEAITNSIQIARNMAPLGSMGNQLQALNNRLANVRGDERDTLQQQADALWNKILAIRKTNEELGSRFPTDALTTIATSTIQSAPLTLRSIAGGGIGALAFGGVGALTAGAPGFVGGLKMGYGFGSFAASSTDMAGLLYIDMLAAGVESGNAANLALAGGALQGFIESGLGVVAGWGSSAVKAIGGRVLSKEAQKQIAELATKNFLYRITHNGIASSIGRNALVKTIISTAGQTASEGLEEALQTLVEQATLSIADAMQDAPVDRNSWGSPEFWKEMRDAVVGGLAGGLGFGIIGLPLNITGNISQTARQTDQLKNMAVTIDDKAEFRSAARKENPLVKHLSDEQIDQLYDSQEPERQAYNQMMREEAARAGRRTASMPTLEAPGETRRLSDGRLLLRVTSPEGEGRTGIAALLDPPTRQRMGSVEFDWDIESDIISIESVELSQAITDREKVIGDMIKELAYKNPGMDIKWNPDEKASAAAGVDLAELKNNLIAENPRGADWGLRFYQRGDRFTQSRAMNEDIDLIASTANVSREIASDTYEAWDTAFRNFGLDTHEMISKMGLTSEDDLRIAADNNPRGVEAGIVSQLDQGMIAAQKTKETPAGGMVVIKQGTDGSPARILSRRAALNEAIDQLRAVTVMTKKANPSTLHHEWLHFMVNVVIPNSPRYRALLEEAVGKKLENFSEKDHEWLADNYERYLKTGEAPTSGLKALFKRIAEALRQFVKSVDVSPKLREFFDQMLAGPDSAMLDTNGRQDQAVENKSRVQTDNERQKAFAEMTEAERIIQSDLHSAGEKAEILYAMAKAQTEQLVRDATEESEQTRNIPSKAWKAGFRPVLSFYNFSLFDQKTDYKAAKNEDIKAANQFVRNYLGREEQQKKITELAERYPDAIVVPIHAIEGDKLNRIPEVIADYIGETTGLEVDTEIVQKPMPKELKRKGQDGWFRLAFRIKFEGEVQSGRKYILVDDNFTTGGSFAELKRYIELNGGEVVEALALSHGNNNKENIIALTEKTRLDLEEKFGIESLQGLLKEEGIHGGNYQSLTEPEALFIFKNARDVYEAKSRIIAARQKGISRIQSRSIQRPQRDAGSQEINSPNDIDILFQAAYHGSPYRFERFDSSHMGSGEGAQAYGWGHYFAGKKEVAEWYREELSTKKYFEGDRQLYDDEAWAATMVFDTTIGDGSKLSREEAIDFVKRIHNQKGQEKYIPLIEKLYENLKVEEGQLYEVDIPGDEETLDWDNKLLDSANYSDKWPYMLSDLKEKGKAAGLYLDGIHLGLTGEEIYIHVRQNFIEEKEISYNEAQKQASLLLKEAGFKGIRYLDASSRGAGEGSHNYVIFDDNEIQITNMFFQMTREEIHAQALRHSSWLEWMEDDKNFVEIFNGEAAYRMDNASEEPYSQKEIEAWYEKQWNEARVLAREGELKEPDEIRIPANAESIDTALLDDEEGSLDWDTELYDNVNKPITTSEANRRLIAKLPRVIDDFVLIMGTTMRENLAHFNAVTEEDAAVRDQIERDQKRVYREAHPYIKALALRLTTGKKLTDTQRGTVMTHMRRSLESGATVYRELYASLTEDQEFVSYSRNEIQDEGAKGEAQKAAKEADGLTAFQRTRIAENIIDKDIARRIRASKATSEEIEDYIDRRNEEIQELDNEIRDTKAELKKSRGETAREHGEAELWRKQYYQTRKELQTANKELERLEKKLIQARIAGTNAINRTKAGREKSEAELKEQLAAKRAEIKTLRQKLKDDVDYAKKHGKLEMAWKLAEERRTLNKKKKRKEQMTADRKAAEKYIKACKDVAAWNMSADRAGMDIWVRQRELILGIQNALFYSSQSKETAEAIQLDADIKELVKKIDKLKTRHELLKDKSSRRQERTEDKSKWRERSNDNFKLEEIEKKIKPLEESLKSLQKKRDKIGISPLELSEMRTEQAWSGSDTIDTGTIMYNGKQMSVEQFRKDFHDRKIRYGFMDSRLRKALRKSAPSKESLALKRKKSAATLAKSLSLEDLLAVKSVIQQLNMEGKANWNRRKFAVQFEQREKIKLLLFQQDELLEEEKKTADAKRYEKAMKNANIEEREKILTEGEKLRETGFESLDNKRLAQHMDGDRKRALYQLLIRDRYRYANRRDVAVEQRISRILDILGQGTAEQREAEKNLSEYKQRRERHNRARKAMKELKRTKITVEGIGGCVAIRKWEYGADFKLNENSMDKWKYGAEFKLKDVSEFFENYEIKDDEGKIIPDLTGTNVELSLADLMFLSVALKNKFSREHIIFGNFWSKDEQAFYEKLGGISKEFKERIEEAKCGQIWKAIDKYIQPRKDLLKIVDAIRDDFEARHPETRATFEDMFNQVVEPQEHYLPIIINEEKHDNAEKQNEIEALTVGSHQVRINPDKGMNLARVDIGPTHQTAIETDIFNVYFKGVEREEHFNKFAPYVRDLNTVLRGMNNNSKQLAAHLKKLHGNWAMDRMYKHINMVGLPPSAKLHNAMDNASNLGKLLAGNASVAYIAFNIPAWLAQYPNSIAAFFGKADARFILSSLFEVMRPGSDLVEKVFEKSPMVKNRVINSAEEFRQHLEKQPEKLKEFHAKFIEIGMMGQRHADKTMVAAGWHALYQTALKDGKSEEDAVIFADEITAETQPDLNALETSPMFKEEGAGKLFLRFLQPLNVVWQNLTYDSFISREKSFATVVPRIVAYGAAALIVAATRGALADKDDEGLDKEELTLKIFYYMLFAQITESVPYIGGMVSGTAERLLTGEGIIYQPRYFELARRILNIPGKLKDENFEGAIRDAITALTLGAGLPISQINRIIKSVQEEDPWIIFGIDQ